jgi:hypothetical protein
MSSTATVMSRTTDAVDGARRARLTLVAPAAGAPAARSTATAPVGGPGERAAALSARLGEYEEVRRSILRREEGFGVDSAEQAERLALACARIAGVWRLIVAHAVEDLAAPDFYYKAAVLAECEAREDARFWRDTARDW